MDFPYIRRLEVNDCHTYQNLIVDTGQTSLPFKHLILTGKNGSGKSSILRGIAKIINNYKVNNSSASDRIGYLQATIQANQNHPALGSWEEEIANLKVVRIFFLGFDKTEPIENFKSKDCLFSYFEAQRLVDLTPVETVTKETVFIEKLNASNDSEQFSRDFKQYLVNKKIYQAFDFMDNNVESSDNGANFFERLEKTLQQIFKDDKIKLIFIRENFEFFLELQDGRKITFNQLPAGFSAFLSILMDLIMRTDLIRKSENNYSLEPAGIVIIDEPETHLHLEMQYEILPIITALFPNIQLIIATHSPAVISSLKNVVVYDLTSHQFASDDVASSSYSEIMTTYLGLDNQFSNIADDILASIESAYKSNDIHTLNSILVANENYLSISLKLEIESRINFIKSLSEDI